MRKKRAIILVTALALICFISLWNTVAYYQSTNGPVRNTFVSAPDFFNSGGGIQLYEHEAVLSNGNYELTSNIVYGNSYYPKDLVQGATIEKDPTVYVTGLAQEAYLFIAVRAKCQNPYGNNRDFFGFTNANGLMHGYPEICVNPDIWEFEESLSANVSGNAYSTYDIEVYLFKTDDNGIISPGTEIGATNGSILATKKDGTYIPNQLVCGASNKAIYRYGTIQCQAFICQPTDDNGALLTPAQAWAAAGFDTVITTSFTS